jgi:hypothetical protein
MCRLRVDPLRTRKTFAARTDHACIPVSSRSTAAEKNSCAASQYVCVPSPPTSSVSISPQKTHAKLWTPTSTPPSFRMVRSERLTSPAIESMYSSCMTNKMPTAKTSP